MSESSPKRNGSELSDKTGCQKRGVSRGRTLIGRTRLSLRVRRHVRNGDRVIAHIYVSHQRVGVEAPFVSRDDERDDVMVDETRL